MKFNYSDFENYSYLSEFFENHPSYEIINIETRGDGFRAWYYYEA